MLEEAGCWSELATQIEMRDSILNNLNIAICVSDLATNEILFANRALQQMHGDNLLTGRLCWEALKNGSKRCESCPMPYLLKNPGKSYQWELCIHDRRFNVHDSIIPWMKGRLAHLQCMTEME